MRSKKPPLKQEASALLADCVAAEAETAVWARFESAMSGLDPKVAGLLAGFFGGTPVTTLSERHNLSEQEVRDCLNRGKRELIEQLRRKSSIRQ